jgi:thymidylate synthase (FAD)
LTKNTGLANDDPHKRTFNLHQFRAKRQDLFVDAKDLPHGETCGVDIVIERERLGLRSSSNVIADELRQTMTSDDHDRTHAETTSHGSRFESFRPISAGLEEILFQQIPVLDHGFIRVVDYMGGDQAVVQAARVSYGRGTRKSSEDAALIDYLMRHAHTTPFEMAEIKLHVKLPIFVARQWIRHRTASVNEYSARYSILDREFYIPEIEQMSAQSSTNRQGRGTRLDEDRAKDMRQAIETDSLAAYQHYLNLLNQDDSGAQLSSEAGLARELSRMILPLNYYTQWYWKIDLHNFMGFLKLRLDPHAQYEIRAYADVLLRILSRWVPMTYEAFLSHRANAVSVSARGAEVLRALLRGESVTRELSGLSSREWLELSQAFQFEEKARAGGK